MQDLRDLLRLIKSGTRNFSPSSNTEEEIRRFQDTAKALVHAQEQGYLDGFRFAKESTTGNRWYIHASVSNGLTYAGEAHLNEAWPGIEPPASSVQGRSAISLKDILHVLDLASRNEFPETLYRSSTISFQAAWELLEAGHLSGLPAQSANGPCIVNPSITLSGRLFLNAQRQEQPPPRQGVSSPSITLDTNCIINLFDRQSVSATSVSDINALIRYGLSGQLTIAVTTRVEEDMLGDPDSERLGQMMRTLEALPVIGSIGPLEVKAWASGGPPAGDPTDRLRKEIKGIVFPGLQPGGNRYQNKMNDVDHLVGHMLNRRDIFVTDDGAILAHSEGLKSSPGIVVMSPGQCVRYIEEISTRSRPSIISTATLNPKYHSPALKGVAKFDYSNNNHRYAIGSGHFLFETQWSKASNTSIHACDYAESIHCLALAKGATSIEHVTDARTYDYSSRTRTPKLNDIILWNNKNGLYAATKVLSLKDDSRGDDRDELEFEYVILADGSTDFSREP